MNSPRFNICPTCGCTPAEALADASVLGLQNQCESGQYTCCQIVEWATEQWGAWTDASIQDAGGILNPATSSSVSKPNLKQFLSPVETTVPNWDAVAKLLNIQFTDC